MNRNSKGYISINYPVNHFNAIEFRQLHEWCIKQFGQGVVVHQSHAEHKPYRWIDWLSFSRVNFRDEEDAILFLLTWSNRRESSG